MAEAASVCVDETKPAGSCELAETTCDKSEALESRGHMQQRHKRELKNIRDQAKRSGKKGKEEFKKREVEMLAVHQREVDDLSERMQSCQVSPKSPTLPQSAMNKRLKAQRRRERQEREEVEKDERIEEELARVGTTERESELHKLQELLVELKLQLFEIPADGNCMYRALAHQCQVHGLPSILGRCQPAVLHLTLRQDAAKHIADNADTFLPFIIDGDSSQAADEQLVNFCTGVKGHEWGSHVELHALSETLCVRIQVFSAQHPVVEMGERFSGSDTPTLQLCYLQHAFSAGEHYHSVVALDNRSDQEQ